MRERLSKRTGIAAFVAMNLISAAALLGASSAAPGAHAEPTQLAKVETPRETPRLRIIDGDTLEDMREDVTYRVVNIDTPETGGRARCEAERALGAEATARARALVDHARHIEFRATGRIDRYGRTIAFVVLDGRDLGESLIAEGFARRWRGRREPWCAANGDLIR